MEYPDEAWGLTLGDGPINFGGSDLFETATTFGTGSTQEQVRLPDTVAADAIRSSQAVQASGPSEWGGFWRDTLRTVIGYGIARDAIRNGIEARAGYPIAQYAPPGAVYSRAPVISGNTLLLLGVVGVGVFLATRK